MKFFFLHDYSTFIVFWKTTRPQKSDIKGLVDRYCIWGSSLLIFLNIEKCLQQLIHHGKTRRKSLQFSLIYFYDHETILNFIPLFLFYSAVGLLYQGNLFAPETRFPLLEQDLLYSNKISFTGKKISFTETKFPLLTPDFHCKKISFSDTRFPSLKQDFLYWHNISFAETIFPLLKQDFVSSTANAIGLPGRPQTCSFNVQSPRESVHFPQFLEEYPPYCSCSWTIETKPLNFIRITVSPLVVTII